jgi:urease subunit gamma/beta
MNLTPTEIDRLVIFSAAEHARRLRRHGVRLSHPEAVALIADEMLLAARKGMGYSDIVDQATRLLSSDDVEPGVASMIEFVSVEANFEQGTKMVIVFRPILPGSQVDTSPQPGEVITPDGDIALNAGRPVIELDVTNTGDRDIQVRSHTHFFETNRALDFDRARAWGMRLDVGSGGGVRFEPGLRRRVALVPIGGERIVCGQAGLAQGRLDDPGRAQAALAAARSAGYLGA